MDQIAHARITIRGPIDGRDIQVPLGASVVSMTMSLVTLPVLGACITRRLQRVQKLSRIPVSAALLLLIYFDSLLFVLASAIVKDVGINRSLGVCQATIDLCFTSYFSTKLLIYYFLVEKAWIVRGRLQRRRDSKLWLFNVFGVMVPYSACFVLNFIFRRAHLGRRGDCIIGTERPAIIPLIACEVVINIYLNFLFILPLRKLYSYQQGDRKMRVLALRTLIGSIATLISTIGNLISIIVMNGQPAWICLIICNSDILFCVVVLHWVTAFDSGGSFSGGQACSCSHPSHHATFPTSSGGQVDLPALIVHLPHLEIVPNPFPDPVALPSMRARHDVEDLAPHGAARFKSWGQGAK